MYRMSKVGLVVLLLAQLLTILQAMAHESEAQAPLQGLNLNLLEHKTQTSVPQNDKVTEHPAGATKAAAEPPRIRRLGIKHRSTDKSVAGGDVIIGGFVTAIFAAVFAYIRVTRKRVSG